jgi:hypothetical protein
MAGEMDADAALERLRPGARPCFLAMSTTYSERSKVAFDSRSIAGSFGRISGHSNFSMSAQDGVSATMS